MVDLHSLAYTYMKNEMYNSLLILSEFMFITDQSKETIFFLVFSLQKLSYHERLVEFLKLNNKFLIYKEIQMIFLSSIKKTTNEPLEKISLDDILPLQTKSLVIKFSILNIDSETILLYHKAMLENDNLKKEMLVKVLAIENYFLEALLAIKQEKLTSNKEFLYIIESIRCKSLKNMYLQIFGKDFTFIDKGFTLLDSFYVFSPYKAMCLAFYFYKNKDPSLFSLGVFMIENYPKNAVSYNILGLDFYRRANYKEAKKCFYESLQMDQKQGKSWMFLGLVYSNLKESENAILCYRKAMEQLTGSYKPILFLGIEYENMNSRTEAKFFFDLAVKRKPNKLTILRKAIFDFLEECDTSHDEICCIKIEEECNEDEKEVLAFVNFFFLVLKGDTEEAKKMISNTKDSWRKKVCLGYIEHLNGIFDKAIEYYNKSMLENKSSSIIESLICNAITSDKYCKMYLFDQIGDVYEYCDLHSLFKIY